MNRRSLLLASFVAGLLGPVPTFSAERAAPSPLTIQQRIDALLKHRIRPDPLPVDLPNPFLVFTGGVRDPEGNGPRPAGAEKGDGTATPETGPAEPPLPPPSNVDVLVNCASRLKIGGVIIINGQRQISLNGVLRKEGDSISADWNNTMIQLRVVHFISGQLTLAYRDAEMTLRF